MPSLVPSIALDTLTTWPTKRLLALRDRLLRCEENLDASDVQDLAEIDANTIRFKDDPRWKAHYDAVRQVLSTREHVPGGEARRAQRELRTKRR